MDEEVTKDEIHASFTFLMLLITPIALFSLFQVIPLRLTILILWGWGVFMGLWAYCAKDFFTRLTKQRKFLYLDLTAKSKEDIRRAKGG